VVKKIRFLTLTPQEFAEGPATSNLLSESEKYALLMNISSRSTDVRIPTGFSPSRVARQRKSRRYEPYPVCIPQRNQISFLNS
jgi:hypothetical protein